MLRFLDQVPVSLRSKSGHATSERLVAAARCAEEPRCGCGGDAAATVQPGRELTLELARQPSRNSSAGTVPSLAR